MAIMRRLVQTTLGATLLLGPASAASAAHRITPLKRCAPDAVMAGAVCLDRYEASVWRVPNPSTTNAVLVQKIQLGIATRADLVAGGAMQLGTRGTAYSPCARNGQNC